MTALYEFKEKEQAREEVRRRIAALMSPQKKGIAGQARSIKDTILEKVRQRNI